MAKINLSPPKFSSHEKNRKVHFKIYDVGDNFSIYIWSKNYHISGFQFYLLNADIKMTGNGYGGICQEYGFNTIISKQGIIYGMAYKSNSKVLPMHSTVDTSDGSSSNFQLLTNISKDNIGYKDGKSKICITDSKVLISDNSRNPVRIYVSGDCNIKGIDKRTIKKIPRIPRGNMISAYNRKRG